MGRHLISHQLPEVDPEMDEDLPHFKEPTDKPHDVKITDEMLDFTMDLLEMQLFLYSFITNHFAIT